MSVVIIGGNERMVCQYTDICKDYGCKAKVFLKEHGSVKKNRESGSDDSLYQHRIPQNGHHCFPEAKKTIFRSQESIPAVPPHFARY